MMPKSIVPLVLAALGAVPAAAKPVLVAVVDDGFEAELAQARRFWSKRPIQAGTLRLAGPMPGWDVADRDGDVRVASQNAAEHWHGSVIAELLAVRLQAYLGAGASDRVEILPVKVLSDGATRPDMSLGTDGIRLAAEAGADVIVCAWSGGQVTPERQAAVDYAVGRGALVVASAGNDGSRTPQFPGNVAGVLAVGAVDASGRRLPSSSHGDWVGMAAPGDSVPVDVRPLLPQPVGFSRTSRAATEVAAVAAALKVLQPRLTSDGIRQILMSSSRSLEATDPSLVGNLGAGQLDARAVLAMAGGTGHARSDSSHPAGLLAADAPEQEWKIAPLGDYRELRLRAHGKLPAKGTLEVFSGGKSLWKGRLQDLNKGFWLNCSRPTIRWRGAPGGWMLEYRMVGVDSSQLYCRGIQVLNQDSGVVEDGSGAFPYAHGCDCKWLLQARPGTRLRIEFTEMATQPNLDRVHLFNGSTTRQDQLLAMFSGDHLPPVLVAPSNQALVWFASAPSGSGAGWRMRWRAVPDTVPMGLEESMLHRE